MGSETGNKGASQHTTWTIYPSLRAQLEPNESNTLKHVISRPHRVTLLEHITAFTSSITFCSTLVTLWTFNVRRNVTQIAGGEWSHEVGLPKNTVGIRCCSWVAREVAYDILQIPVLAWFPCRRSSPGQVKRNRHCQKIQECLICSVMYREWGTS